MQPQPVMIDADLIKYGDRIYFPTNPRYPGDWQVLANIPNRRDKDFRWLRLVSLNASKSVRLLIHKNSGVALSIYRK